jgi:hypothetical protein
MWEDLWEGNPKLTLAGGRVRDPISPEALHAEIADRRNGGGFVRQADNEPRPDPTPTSGRLVRAGGPLAVCYCLEAAKMPTIQRIAQPQKGFPLFNAEGERSAVKIDLRGLPLR